MGEINGRQINFFPAYVIPYIELRPVTDWKYAYVFPFLNLTIIDVPEFGPLPLGIPLSEFIPNRKYSFFGPGFFFVPSCSADAGIKSKFFYRIQQGVGLQRVAACKFTTGFFQRFFPDCVFDLANDEFFSDTFYQAVTIIQGLLKIVAGIDMYQRKWKFSRAEGFQRQMHQGYRILSTAKQEGRFFKLACYFPQDVNCFALQLV